MGGEIEIKANVSQSLVEVELELGKKNDLHATKRILYDLGQKASLESFKGILRTRIQA